VHHALQRGFRGVLHHMPVPRRTKAKYQR